MGNKAVKAQSKPKGSSRIASLRFPSKGTNSKTVDGDANTSAQDIPKRLSLEVHDLKEPEVRQPTGTRFPFNVQEFDKVKLRKPESDYVKEEQRKKKLLDADSRKATELLPFLFVSGDLVAQQKDILVENGITHILNSAHSVCRNYHSDDPQFTYLDLHLLDSSNEGISFFILQAIVFVERARKSGGKCLIHCHQGVSRSCTLVIAYLMWYKKWPYHEAFVFVKDRRKVCRPNTGFTFQLLAWQKRLGITSSPSKTLKDSLQDGQDAFAVNTNYRPEMAVTEIPPVTSELYRIAPHSSLDSTLVAKLCCNDFDKPILPNVSALDARGAFLVYMHEKSLFAILVGKKCAKPIEFLKAACRIGRWMVSIEPRFANVSLSAEPELNLSSIDCTASETGVAISKLGTKETKSLWQFLGANDRGSMPAQNTTYNADYGVTEIETPRMSTHSRKASTAELLDGDVEVDTLVTHLFICEDAGEWEQRRVYEEDDLTQQAIVVVMVHDRSKHPANLKKVPSHKIDFGTLSVDIAYVWLGANIESILNAEAAMEKATSFIREKINTSSGKPSSNQLPTIVRVDSGSESSEFWTAFQAGF